MSEAWDPPSIEEKKRAEPPEPPPLPEEHFPETPSAEVNSSADINLTERQLGDYRLLRRLGRGAMAVVYLAEQCSLRRQVALKLLRSELAEDETYVKRFHNEARAAAALIHANIVQTHEVGCIDGIHFIAQEYVAGQNVAQLIARKGTLDQSTAVRIMAQVASALSKAGQQGVVHRDIKPENLMFAKSGEVKVADFGLARIAEGEPDGSGGSKRSAALNLTQVGMTMGTPLYMSPEQVQGKKLDTRSDLYSFGVTCYHMLSGSPPFEGDTALNVAVQHVNDEPVSLGTVRQDLDPELCRIVHRMLAKKPDERYASARELWRDLRPLCRDADIDVEDLSDTAISGVEQYWSSDQQRTEAIAELGTMMMAAQADHRPRRLWLWATLAVIIALAGGAAIGWATRKPPLLAGAETYKTGIAAQGSAKDQYAWAMSLARISPPDEQREAWQSVLEHFPDDSVYAPLAKLQLAWLATRQEQTDVARELYSELSSLGDSEKKLRSIGYAGEFVVLSLEEDEAAADKLKDFAADIGGLTPNHMRKFAATLQQTLGDNEMARLMALLIRKQQQSVNADEAAKWDKFLETNFPEDPEEDVPSGM